MKIKYIVCVAMVALATHQAAKAQMTVGVSGDPTGTIRTDTYPYGAGFGFYVPSGVGTTINQLGFWDQGGDGLQADHTVALYKYAPGTDHDYTLVASVTILAGTANPLSGGYRWGSIPSVFLDDNGQGGNYYTILASNASDPWTDLSGGLSLNSSIGTFSSGSVVDQGSGQFVGQNVLGIIGGSAGYGGANLGFAAQAVPEPGTCTLVGSGLAILFAVRRKRSSV